MSYGLLSVVVIASCLASMLPFLAQRPVSKPGNLAPIQPITALGAWSLIILNSAIAGAACSADSVALAIAPIATVIGAAILFARNQGTGQSGRAIPDSVEVVIAEIRGLLGGARRLGLDQIDAVIVGAGPRIGVAVPSRGRVVVRMHESMMAWIDRHRRQGGASSETVGSFIRFAVLHELGHILNGDHRTFRFARSVLVAHLWWLLSLITVPWALMHGRDSDLRRIVSATAFVVLMVIVQSLIARRFIAEREQLADWRAMQSLSMEDASRLLRRRGIPRGGRPPPTEIEKLMIDLNAESGAPRRVSLLDVLIRHLWPNGDSVHQRASAFAGDRAGAPAHPVRWAALTGGQCGVMAISAAMGVFLVAGQMPEQMAFLTLIVLFLSAVPACAYCVMRTDPVRLSVRSQARTRLNIVTGGTFALTFIAGVFATDWLARALGITAWVPQLMLTVVAIGIALMTGYFAWQLGAGKGDSGGGHLVVSPKAQLVLIVPFVAALTIVLFPFSIAVSYWLGLGGPMQGSWVAILLCSTGSNVLSTSIARSPRRMLASLAPMAILDTPAPVFGLRFFWMEIFLDISRCSFARAGMTIFGIQTVTNALFAMAFGFAMRQALHFLNFSTVVIAFFFLGIAISALFIVVPNRWNEVRHVLRLIDQDRLELLVALLQSAQYADQLVGGRIRDAMARNLPNDQAVTSFLLPDRRALHMLPSLLSYIHLARAIDAPQIIDVMRGRIEKALNEVLIDHVVVAAPGEPPSLYYSALAATIVDESGLIAQFPFESMLDRIESMLAEQLSSEVANLVADILAATRLLEMHARPIPDAATIRRFLRRSTLMSKPDRRQSLVELCDLAELLGDAEEKERLAPIVRSRMWEILQLNPRKEVRALLDCYLAAIRLGERESMLVSAATVIVSEIASRTADELMAL